MLFNILFNAFYYEILMHINPFSVANQLDQ